MLDGVSVSDANGNFIKVNKAFTEMFDYQSVKQLVGKPFLDYVAKREIPKIFEVFMESLKKKENFIRNLEVTLRKKNGSEFPTIVNISNLWDKDRNLVGSISVIRDITEIKKAQEKLKALNEKLEVVGRLTRHDVNNKLATVRANVYLAKQGLTGDSQALQYLSEIDSAVGQAELVFDFARVYEMLGVEALEYVNVEDAVEGACKQFSDLKVKVVNDCGGLRVLADSMLSRLLYNFVDNSLKHGEKVTRIRVYYEEAKDKLRLIYEDDGVGIPEAEKEKIFEQGYGKGSGLGLYMIMKMCEVYGWTIKETGKPNKGARFIMSLPKVNMDEGKTGYQLPS